MTDTFLTVYAGGSVQSMIHVSDRLYAQPRTVCGKPVTLTWHEGRVVRGTEAARDAATCNLCRRLLSLRLPRPA